MLKNNKLLIQKKKLKNKNSKKNILLESYYNQYDFLKKNPKVFSNYLFPDLLPIISNTNLNVLEKQEAIEIQFNKVATETDLNKSDCNYFSKVNHYWRVEILSYFKEFYEPISTLLDNYCESFQEQFMKKRAKLAIDPRLISTSQLKNLFHSKNIFVALLFHFLQSIGNDIYMKKPYNIFEESISVSFLKLTNNVTDFLKINLFDSIVFSKILAVLKRKKVDNDLVQQIIYVFKQNDLAFTFQYVQTKDNLYNIIKDWFPTEHAYKDLEAFFLSKLKNFIVGAFELLSLKGLFCKNLQKLGKHKYKSLLTLDLTKVSNPTKLYDFMQHGLLLFKLPMLVPPKDWSDKVYGGFLLNPVLKQHPFISPSFKCSVNTKPSDLVYDCVNLLQRKQYKFSTMSLELWFSDPVLNDAGILSFNEFQLKADAYREITENFIPLTKSELKKFMVAKNLYNFQKKKKNIKKKYASWQEVLLECSISEVQFEKFNEKKKLFNELNDNNAKLIRHLQLFAINNLYQDFIIYNINIVDFRLRIYSQKQAVSRESGLGKYLLENSSSSDFYIPNAKTITLLKAIIVKKAKNNIRLVSSWKSLSDYFDEHLLGEFETFLNKEKEYWRDPVDDVSKHITFKILTPGQSFLDCFLAVREYFKIGLHKLKNKPYLSNYTIELDQTCSGPAILALISPFDYNIWKHLNLLYEPNVDIKLDFYQLWLNHFYSKLTQRVEFSKLTKVKFDKIFSRKFGKSIVMPYFYNLTPYGVSELVDDYFKTTIVEEYLEKDWLFLKEKKKEISSIIYTSFLDFCPNIANLMIFFDKFSKKVAEHNKKMCWKVMDGSIISTYYNEFDYQNRYCKVLSKRIRYTLMIRKNNTNVARTKASFLPNFIHSLDASILKLIVLEIEKRHGLIIEPLHDCFRYPLNYHEEVLEVIRSVYEREFSKPDFLEKYVLNPILFNLPSGHVKTELKTFWEENLPQGIMPLCSFTEGSYELKAFRQRQFEFFID